MQTKNSIDCRKAEVYAQLLLDGRLTSKERLELDSHTLNCPTCASMVDELRSNSHRLSTWTPALNKPAPDSSFNAKIMLAISQEPQSQGQVVSTDGWKMGMALLLVSLSCVAFGFAEQYQLPASLQPILHALSLPGLPSWWSEIQDWSRSIFTTASFDQIAIPAMPSWIGLVGCLGIALNIAFALQAKLGRKSDHAI